MCNATHLEAEHRDGAEVPLLDSKIPVVLHVDAEHDEHLPACVKKLEEPACGQCKRRRCKRCQCKRQIRGVGNINKRQKASKAVIGNKRGMHCLTMRSVLGGHI